MMASELPWMWAGAALYALATAQVLLGLARQRPREKLTLALLLLAMAAITAGIVERWLRIGHGPLFSMFEALSSSLLGLSVVFAVAYWRLPLVRASAVVTLPLLLVMASWLVVADPADTHFLSSFNTPWLWAHLLMGKLFLGLCVVGVGIGGVILLRRSRWARWFHHAPPDAVLDQLAWRFMGVALVFESLMLIAGAVWAQDAWGRYWDWDPLETAAFITWLALVAGLHVRLSYRTPPWVGALMIFGVFILAFLTFFGVPFVSMAVHQGTFT